MIKITALAAKHLKRIMGKKEVIFFGAKGGGCNGFEYVLRPSRENLSSMNELISINGIPMVICGKSTFMLIGTTIDWKDDNMGSRFIFTNPNAAGTCGCGSTFSL